MDELVAQVNHDEPPPHRASTGWVEVIAGSMFSGKSEELIRRLRRAKIARQKVQVFKPEIDSRFSNNQIVSHSEMRHESANSRSATEVLAKVEPDTEVVGIDEGQFFDNDLVDVAKWACASRRQGDHCRARSGLYGTPMGAHASTTGYR